MSKIYNSDVTKGLAQNAGIQINVDKVPNELAEKIVPTFETNPLLLRRATILGSTTTSVSGSATIFSNTNAAKRTFITGISAGIIKDAACDRPTGSISVYIQPKGKAANTSILEFPIITLTAQQMNYSVTFSDPIELERNVGVTMNGAFEAGVLVRSAVVYGYQLDNE